MAAAIELLGLNIVSDLIEGLGVYLPQVLGGILILLIGLVLGDVCRHTVVGAASQAGIPYAQGLGNAIRIAILSVAIMVALDQLGVENRVLILALGTTLAMTLGAVALAFWPGRTYNRQQHGGDPPVAQALPDRRSGAYRRCGRADSGYHPDSRRH